MSLLDVWVPQKLRIFVFEVHWTKFVRSLKIELLELSGWCVQLLNKHKIHEYLRIELDPIASCALDKCNYPRLSWRDRGWEFWSAMKHLFLAISRFLRSIRRIRIVCHVHVNQSTNESTVFGACRKVCVAETASIDYPFVRERYSVSRGLKTLPQERGRCDK